MKKVFTSLLLASTLLSCAAARVEPPVGSSERFVTPESSFVFGDEVEIQPPAPSVLTKESIPITVVPPPEGTALEEIATANYPYMLLRPTGATNNFGNPIYEVAMFAGGRLVGTVNAVTGRAHTQSRNRNVAGNEAPLPNGTYRVSTNWIPGTHPEVGGRFLPITPMFATNRSALGFHVDPSFNRDSKEDGTAGCIGTTTVAERDILFQFAQQYKPRYLKVSI